MVGLGEVIGNYEIVAELKRGGMGVVYTARHRSMGQMAVVKKLLPEHTGSTDTVQRFFQEAQAAAALDDPGIVRIFDQGVLGDGSAYIVMELLQGESLADRLRRVGRIAPAQAMTFVRQAARAVSKAHARGIIHRDLKPDNLFIVPDPDIAGGERIKVLDFGIAKLAGDARVKTMTAMPMGTPAYMSPEQWASAGRVDGRTDVYAFGIILFEMLVGRLPFDGPGLIEFIDQHRFQPAPPISSIDPSLTTFDPIIARCLAKNPDERFASLDELVRALPGGPVTTNPQPISVAHAATLPAGGMAMGSAAPVPSTLGGAASSLASQPPAPARRGISPLWLGLTAVVAVGATIAIILTLGSGGKDDKIDAAAPMAAAMVAIDAAQAEAPPPPPAVDAAVAVDTAVTVDAAVAVASSDRPHTPPDKPKPKRPEPPEPPHGPPPLCDEVACVLNNYEGACCRKFKKPTPPENPDLPETLSKADILAGISAVRSKVQACGDSNPDNKGLLPIKITITPAGTVAGALAEGDLASTPLGGCAVAAMKQATFKKSQKGVTVKYPFNFK
jgi:serine/threonine-protein kinase